MKRIAFVFALLVAGCDPVYQLTYSVVNHSGRPVYIAARGDYSSAVIKVAADSTEVVHFTPGIGFAKEKFEEEIDDVASGLYFFSDSLMSDSALFSPRREWVFHRSGIYYGSATLTILKRDVK